MTPWELLEQPAAYIDMALMSLEAENNAEKQKNKRRRKFF